MTRPLAFRLVAILLGIVGGLMVLEVALRAYKAWTHRDAAEALARTATALPPPFSGSCEYPAPQARLRDLIELSTREELAYVLKPSIDTCYFGARFRTNALRVRGGAPVRIPKEAGTFRILSLGDSYAMGQGVADDETYALVLQAMLRRGHGKSVEVINAGVDGYNTIQEAAWLEEMGASLEPDCIVLLWCGNDTDPPTNLKRPATGMDLDRSYLLRALRSVLRPPTDPWADRLGTVDAHDVLPEYRHWAGVEGHVLGLRMIAEYTKRTGIPFVFFAHYDRFRDFSPAEAFIKKEGVQRPVFKMPTALKYQVSVDNGHWNRAGHEEAARRMLPALVACGPRCTGVDGVPPPDPTTPVAKVAPSVDVFSLVPPDRLVLSLTGFANGRIGSFMVEGNAGLFSLIVSARAESCPDETGRLYPELVATLDGKRIGSWQVTSQKFASYSTGAFELSGTRQDIELSMAHDLHRDSTCDRKVHLDWAEIVGAASGDGGARRP